MIPQFIRWFPAAKAVVCVIVAGLVLHASGCRSTLPGGDRMDAEIPTAFADNEGRVERLLADIDALEGVLQDYKTVIGNDVLSRIEHIGVSARNELLVESDYLSRLGEFEELLELRRRSLDKELGALVSEVMKER